MTKKVLIVEDYRATLEMMVSLLKTEGIAVVTAHNGKEGVAKALAEKPDLILCDILMPEMGGIEACKLIKDDPSTAQIPVIMITVRTDEETRNASEAVGANEYVNKPFDPQLLLELIKKYL